VARDAYLQHLSGVPLFASCNRKQLSEIGRVADEVTIQPGTTLVKQGAIGVELFIIVEGTASVTRDGQMIATLGKGDFVGELAVLAHRGRRNATVTADTEVTVLVLTASGLEQLLDDIPGLAKQLLREVVNRLPDTEAPA
jgi:CRP/FNR family transcriptional regulator, cyclic AMP receptor protein